MIEFLNSADTQIFLAINGFRAPMADGFMAAVSNRFVWIPLYVALFMVMIHRFGWRSALTLLAGAALAVLMADQLCATIIRPLACRLRPANLDNPLSALVHIVGDYRGGRYGFPSCHAANTVAITVFMTFAFGRRLNIMVLLGCWALLNCWSRIYLGVHYPGDLIVGAILGAICGYVAFNITDTLLARNASRVRNAILSPNILMHRLTIGQKGSLTITHPFILVTIALTTLACAFAYSLATF